MSRKFILMTDATCDLPENFTNENNLVVIPMGYSLDGVTYSGIDDDKLSPADFYKKEKEGAMPSTFQINPDTFKTYFEKYLNAGKDVIYIAFSSALSGTCNTAKLVASQLKENYKNNSVIVVDSLCASLGEGLFLYYAIKKADTSCSLLEMTSYLEDLKLHVCHNFTVDDLHHLHRGGRVSKVSAVIGTLLSIKPVLHVDNDGKLVPVAKVRTRKKSLIALVDNMELKLSKTLNNDIIFISHGDNIDDANYIKTLVEEKLGFKTFLIAPIGAVIGTHSGPNTIALFFLGEDRNF